MEHGHHLFPVALFRGDKCGSHGTGVLLVLAAAGGRRPCSAGHAVGNPMEPGTKRVLNPERPGLLDQDQKRGLEGVLGIVMVSQGLPADAQNHRAVTLDQGGEGQLGGLATPGQESLQELPVGQLADRPQIEQSSKPPLFSSARSSCHESTPVQPVVTRPFYGSNATGCARGSGFFKKSDFDSHS